MLVRHVNSKLKPQLQSLSRLACNTPSLSCSKTHFFDHHKLLGLLTSCRDLEILERVHALLITAGLSFDISSNTHLINHYSSFKRCELSRLVFDSTPNPGVIMWNSMIRAYTRTSQYKEALQLYRVMRENLVQPDKYTYTFVLKACTGILDFKVGNLVHGEIVERRLENDVFIATALVDMHSKFGDLERAREVFVNMPNKDVVAWNAMISGLSQSAEPSEALELFKHMQFCCGVVPNAVSLLNLYPAVSKLMDVKPCMSIHGFVWRRSFPTVVLNGLIDVYAKCGCCNVARWIFDRMVGKDDVTWGTLMAGYVHNGLFCQVMELFDCLKRKNLKMNNVSAVNALLAASELKDLDKGLEIRDYAVRQGVDSDVMVSTSLLTMYVKCGEVEKAIELFWAIQERDLVAWSAIIAALAQSGNYEEALSVFQEMQDDKLKANAVTLVSVLPACAELCLVKLGKCLHCYAIKGAIDSHLSVGTALVSMYAKCGLFSSALNVFHELPNKEVVTWNALINGYAQVGDPDSVMEIFCKLRLIGLHPDSGTMVGVLPACALLGDLYLGSCIHGQIISYGLESNCHMENALMDMYAKCRSLSSAEVVFKQLETFKDEVSWNTMIAGYIYNGFAKEAISTFYRMKSEAFQPNLVTVVSVLPAVACLTALREGMAIHAYIILSGFQSYTLTGNGLIDMYAKCGRLDCSEQIFMEMNHKNTVSWNAMIAACSVHGLGDRALAIFRLMQESEVKIDSISFISVLSACRHSGLTKEGKEIFNSMKQKYCLEPGLEHYACMVDLLGRAGLLDEIMDLIKQMPMQPDAGVWGALLGASRMHSNLELGELALKNLTDLEQGNHAHYIVLSNLYSQSGRWDDSISARARMEGTGMKKTPGCSWVEIKEALQIV